MDSQVENRVSNATTIEKNSSASASADLEKDPKASHAGNNSHAKTDCRESGRNNPLDANGAGAENRTSGGATSSEIEERATATGESGHSDGEVMEPVINPTNTPKTGEVENAGNKLSSPQPIELDNRGPNNKSTDVTDRTIPKFVEPAISTGVSGHTADDVGSMEPIINPANMKKTGDYENAGNKLYGAHLNELETKGERNKNESHSTDRVHEKIPPPIDVPLCGINDATLPPRKHELNQTSSIEGENKNEPPVSAEDASSSTNAPAIQEMKRADDSSSAAASTCEASLEASSGLPSDGCSARLDKAPAESAAINEPPATCTTSSEDTTESQSTGRPLPGETSPSERKAHEQPPVTDPLASARSKESEASSANVGEAAPTAAAAEAQSSPGDGEDAIEEGFEEKTTWKCGGNTGSIAPK